MVAAQLFSSRFSAFRLSTAAAAATCVANATWWMQPVLMHDLITSRGLGEAAAGSVLSVEMGAMALGSAIIARLGVGRSLLAIMWIGFAIAIAGSVLTFNVGSYNGLLIARAIAGLGAGGCLMVSNTVTSLFPDPDKAFARLGVANLIFGTALLGALPLVPAIGGYAGPYMAVLLSFILLLIPASLLRSDVSMPASSVAADQAPGIARSQRTNIILLVVATFLIGVASGTVWAFYALIGEQAGLSETEVSSAISTAVLTALGGAGLAALLGGRFGRVVPCCAALITMSAAILALSFEPGPIMFRIATCANIASLYFLMPYLFGAAAAQDGTGRAATYASSVFFFTGAVSPALGGLLVSTVGMDLVGISVVFIAVLSGAIMIKIERDVPGKSVDLGREGPIAGMHDPKIV